MNERDTLKDFLKPKSSMKIALVVVSALLLAAIAGVVYFSSQPVADAVPMSYGAKSGDYVTVDVAIITDWIVKSDDTVFYTVFDMDWNTYIMSLTDSQYARFTDARAYWEADDPSKPLPAPVTVSGTANAMDSELADMVADVWDLSSASDTYEAFGRVYIKGFAQPMRDGEAISILLAVFLFFLWIILLASQFRVRSTKKCLDRLEALGELSRAASELSAPDNETFDALKLTLTEHYAVAQATGVILRYEDMAWCYRFVQRAYFIKVNETLVCCTKTIGQMSLFAGKIKKSDGDVIAEAVEALFAHNGELLIGYTGENAKAYRAIKKQAKTENL